MDGKTNRKPLQIFVSASVMDSNLGPTNMVRIRKMIEKKRKEHIS